MRVTTNMLSRGLLDNLQNSAGNLLKLQDQLSSGNKITKPSDDPVGIQNSMRYKSTQNAVDLWQSNATEAITYMQTADSSMSEVNSMLNRIRTLTVQAANGDLTPDQRNSISAEVGELEDQIRVVANNKMGNRYLFGGIDNAKPMPNPSTNEWQGSSGTNPPATYQVGDNLSIEVTVDGSDFFPQIFATLDSLMDGLKGDDPDDPDKIQAALGGLDASSDALLKNQAQLGAKTNRLTAIQSQLQDTSDNLSQNISNIEDLDYAKAILDYQTQENSYRAALQVGATLIQPSLVDFMK